MNLPLEKSALRSEVTRRLKGISRETRATAGVMVLGQLQQCPGWRKVRAVGLYWPFGLELDLVPVWRDLILRGVRVAAPAFRKATEDYVWREVHDPDSQFIAGAFGVSEPSAACPEVAATELDWILVPGVAFDEEGGRLGRGKGHYDRWLLGETPGIRCGIGFEEQIVPKVPLEPHDIRLHYVMTPTRVRSPRPGGSPIHAN